MSWLQKLLPSVVKTKNKKVSIPEGLWKKCSSCYAILYRPELERDLDVCPKCGQHLRIGASKRIAYFLDAGEHIPLGEEVKTLDPLKFKDSKTYPQRIAAAQQATESSEALVVKQGKLFGLPVIVCVFEFAFMGGSMGAVVGERFSIAAKAAIDQGFPLVCFSASGGARMQEGLFSLFQMAKTSSLIAKMNEAGVPYISVLTDPVYGGVSASLANLGDIIIAEPKAMVGFAGPRVIEQTVREQLPTNFQTSEFLLDRGVIDMICPRIELRPRIAKLLQKLQNNRINELSESVQIPANLTDPETQLEVPIALKESVQQGNPEQKIDADYSEITKINAESKDQDDRKPK